MQSIWQQTPDGRPIARDPDPSRHVAQPPERSRPPRPRASTLAAFVSASIAALPELPDRPGPRVALVLFLIGAADRFWRCAGLHRSGFAQMVAVLLHRHGLSASQTAALIDELPELRKDPAANAVLDDGAQALDEWLIHHDRNMALRLTELVARWERGNV